MEARTLYFEQPGKANTEATLQIAAERAKALGITQVVLATSHGYTAETAHRIFAGTGGCAAAEQKTTRDGEKSTISNTGVKIIAVTISAGYTPEGWVMTPAERQAIEAKGIPVVMCLNGLTGGVNDALSDSVPGKVICKTYYTFGQGMKVAVEVAIMAADAGLLDMEKEAIAIAGSGEGADTAIVISPVYARHFPELQIHEILAKPR